MHDDIRSTIHEDFPRTMDELEQMIRIPSVSAPGYDPAAVRASADLVADLMRASGLDDVRLLELEGAHPAVYGERRGPEGAPTLLLYAHHDVQPPGPASEWDTDPFAPHVEGGRLYGRGSADDKCGIAMHLASIRAFGDHLPVTVKVFIEGEEEVGSHHLVDFLDAYADLLSADAIIIGDAGNWLPGVPGLTTSLRGLVDCIVTVRTLRYAVHSGSFGGAYPDAITSLARILSRLHEDDGTVAIGGLVRSEPEGPEVTGEDIAGQALPVEGVSLIGQGTLASRLWSQPSISVLAIEAVPIGEAINQIVPTARAKVSMRLAPGEDADRAMDALVAHIEEAAPWGVQVSVERGGVGEAFALDTTGPTYDAYRAGMRVGYGHEVVEMGMGGSIPFVAAFAERYPNAEVLLIGVSDPTSRYHGPNESVEIADLESSIVAQAVAFRELTS
jgi:acetylornithine deacetylase/succinyl-diaminopimelate desuccinylase-like protein